MTRHNRCNPISTSRIDSPTYGAFIQNNQKPPQKIIVKQIRLFKIYPCLDGDYQLEVERCCVIFDVIRLADDVSLQCEVNLWPVAGLVRHRAQRCRRPALCVV